VKKFEGFVSDEELQTLQNVHQQYHSLGMEDFSEKFLTDQFIRPLVSVFNPQIITEIYLYAGWPFVRKKVNYLLQLNGKIDLISALKPAFAGTEDERIAADAGVEDFVRDRIEDFLKAMKESNYATQSPESLAPRFEDKKFDDIVKDAMVGTLSARRQFAFTAASFFKENTIYISLLLEVKVDNLLQSPYLAQSLGYVANVAHFLGELLEAPLPLFISVILSNGEQFLVQKALFNHISFLQEASEIPYEGRNYYARTDVYNLFNNGVVDSDAAAVFKFFCNPLKFLRQVVLNQ